MALSKNKKGQAAIEFLMTYGWMLLVVLIVGALIFSFVDFGSLLPSKVDLSNSFRGDAQRLVASASSSNVQFVVRYVGGRVGQVDLNNNGSVSLTPVGGKTCNFLNLTDASQNAQSSGIISFVNGQESVISFNCTATGGGNLIKGDVVEGTVTIKYSDPRTQSLTLVSTGPLRVPVTD